MATTEMLMDLFRRRLEESSREKGLTVAEQEKIFTVFRQALANGYMDDHKIYTELIREDQS